MTDREALTRIVEALRSASGAAFDPYAVPTTGPAVWRQAWNPTPIRAWRVERVAPHGLTSPFHESGDLGTSTPERVAVCAPSHGRLSLHSTPAPSPRCSCGVFAYDTPDGALSLIHDARKTGWPLVIVVGLLEDWLPGRRIAAVGNAAKHKNIGTVRGAVRGRLFRMSHVVTTRPDLADQMERSFVEGDVILAGTWLTGLSHAG